MLCCQMRCEWYDIIGKNIIEHSRIQQAMKEHGRKYWKLYMKLIESSRQENKILE